MEVLGMVLVLLDGFGSAARTSVDLGVGVVDALMPATISRSWPGLLRSTSGHVVRIGWADQ
jgi:hypothetical protein